MPPDVDEILPTPPWKVLMDAVKDCEPEDAVIPTWKLKPVLGNYSPTPQYAPLTYIEPKPYWRRSAFVKRKMKKFYNKLEQQKLEAMGQKARYLPNPNSRLAMAGTQLLRGHGVLKSETNMLEHLRKMSEEQILTAINDQKSIRLGLAAEDLPINWRTPAQMTAQKKIQETISRVDVVLEVRDARLPWLTTHPDVPRWVRPKPRVIVLTHADLVPPHCLEETINYMKATDRDRGVPIIGVDAMQGGDEIEDLREEILKAGAYVNRRRRRKGINPRGIRTMMVGFPNTGKSSIINRLSHRKVAQRTHWAGNTKKLTWHKIGGFRNTELEFLDTPGIIPPGFGKRYTEEEANLLCMCRIFGDVAIDREKTAYELVFRIGKLAKDYPHMVDKTFWRETKRIYGVDFDKALKLEGPFLPNFVPLRNPAPFCGKILKDFNSGFWGKIQLEPPPQLKETQEDRIPSRTETSDFDEGPYGRKERNPIRGALAPARSSIQLPTANREAPEREKVLLPGGARGAAQGTQPQREAAGLFDGW